MKTRCKITKNILYKQIKTKKIMEKDFITTRNLVTLKYYGFTFRLDVIEIDNNVNYNAVTIRTCSKNDEVTLMFDDLKDAFAKFDELVHDKKIVKGGIFFIKQ